MAFWCTQKDLKTFEAALSGSPVEIREAALAYLRTHRKWYVFWSRVYTHIWNIATFLIIVIGALTSILTAYGEISKPLLIVLPAISSLLGALLVQFRFRDVWRLRELGRISTEELICEAYLIPQNDRAEALKAAINLRLQAHKLERDQLSEFFGEPSDLRMSSKPIANAQRDQEKDGRDEPIHTTSDR